LWKVKINELINNQLIGTLVNVINK
jgi:hypothetical protein